VQNFSERVAVLTAEDQMKYLFNVHPLLFLLLHLLPLPLQVQQILPLDLAFNLE